MLTNKSEKAQISVTTKEIEDNYRSSIFLLHLFCIDKISLSVRILQILLTQLSHIKPNCFLV
jgi:hypothetical protein